MSGSAPPEYTLAHATGNDFVFFADPENAVALSEQLVRALCDRRRGLGADGVIVAVAAEESSPARWFMDYRNADGSIAQMCGNGARAFVQFLIDSGLEVDPTVIQTRAGDHRVVRCDGLLGITMGTGQNWAQRNGSEQNGSEQNPSQRDGDLCRVTLGSESWAAHSWWLPNPHAVVFLESRHELDNLDLATAPTVDDLDRYPDGQNTEFVVVRDESSRTPASVELEMRVYERGVGETLSCGTGAVAAALAAWERAGLAGGARARVHVPGGVLTIVRDETGECVLAGPTETIATGTIDARWWDTRSNPNSTRT